MHLVEMETGNFGRYGLVGPAIFGWSVGLHVPSVHVTGTSTEENKYTRFLGSHGVAGSVRLVTTENQTRNRQVYGTDAASL
jgi:hypothetical protein